MIKTIISYFFYIVHIRSALSSHTNQSLCSQQAANLLATLPLRTAPTQAHRQSVFLQCLKMKYLSREGQSKI